MKLFRRVCHAATLCFLGIVSDAHAAPPDVRVLIDTSGSMRQNDPANLRASALRLLTELLPSGATAGVWLFDTDTTQLVAPSTVDKPWKASARAAAGKVNSRGLFTNIEAAQTAATANWTEPNAAKGSRQVILLTDGMVDVGKDPADNAASRARILNEALPRLKTLGATINTIALSEHADRALLETLAKTTEGWSAQTQDAAALQRIFLHMFEQAAPPTGVPLQGNHFSVDTSVKELTLLVFAKSGAPPLQITRPDKGAFIRETVGQDVAWQHEEGYDLVTISQPAAGDWSFNAAADPDNRALIVTDLELALDPPPTNVVPGEPLSVAARLTNKGTPIQNVDFLKLVKTNVATSSSQGAGNVSTLSLDSTSATFGGAVDTALPPGDYQLLVRADGGTFQREQRRQIKINGPPFTFTAETARDDDGARVIHLTVTADATAIDPTSFSGLLELTMPGKPPQVIEMPGLENNEITLELGAEFAGDYTLQPWVFAATQAGRAVRLKPDPLLVSYGAGRKVAKSTATKPAAIKPVPTPPSPSINWVQAGFIVGAGNLSLGSVLGGLWYALRRRRLPPKGVSL